jgi:hypothetical protein
MNVLLLYNATQTFTNTVFEHVSSFSRHSRFRYFFCHCPSYWDQDIDLSRFDAVVIHYSIRLPFDQVSPKLKSLLSAYSGCKALFIQDEYDHTQRAWYWIKTLGIRLVFTVVPEAGVATVYPPSEFPGVVFQSNLTGYVPETLPDFGSLKPASERPIVVGYRGRPLPIRYGELGLEKVSVGKLVKTYCDDNHISHDIAWSEESRIYGNGWYDFVGSCRSMLGSESGSNVFDWDGSLGERIERYRKSAPNRTDEDIYLNVIKPIDTSGLMNQVSPRLFETVAFGTVLVLFEGSYSGVVSPDVHFIPLRKDGANISDVFRQLSDPQIVQRLVSRSYEDVILSQKYSYKAFVGRVDAALQNAIAQSGQPNDADGSHAKVARAGVQEAEITTAPVRANPPLFAAPSANPSFFERTRASSFTLAYRAWSALPEDARKKLKPRLKALIKGK